jgi:hypothetical protein
VLKLFIVSVKSAYQRCSKIAEIVDQVDACPVQTAGRPLVSEEVQLRTTWIYAVALMLDQVAYPKKENIQSPSEEAPMEQEVRNTYGPIVEAVMELHASGGSLKTREFLEQNASSLPESIHEDDVQYAIVSQTIKVMWYTLVVLQEERMASGDDEPSPLSARPPIPRGSGIN